MIKTLNDTNCKEILENNYVGYLSYISKNKPHTIPISYYYDQNFNYIICYSGMGHKIRYMRKNTSVSLAVAEIYRSNKWESVLAHGTYEEVDGGTAKLFLHEFSLGIKRIILEKENTDLDYISEFSSKIHTDDIPIVYLIKVEELTGKMRS